MADLINKDDNLNQGRVKLNESIKDAGKAKTDAAGALARSLSAEQISLLAKAMAQNTQTQLNNVIIESGTSDAETIQARKNYPVLNDRLNDTDVQLAETTKKTNTNTTTRETVIGFITDDGQTGDFDVIAPLFESKNIPLTLAIITGAIGLDKYLDIPQIRDLQSRGFKFSNHTSLHHNLDTLSEQDLRRELQQSQDEFKEIFGRVSKGLVYPGGANNDFVVSVARDYFDYAVATVNEGYVFNDDFVDQYVIPRTVTTYNMGTEPRPIATLKGIVDIADANKSLLVYCIHAYEFTGNNSGNLALLEQLLDYIKSKNIKCVDLDTALELRGNTLDIGTLRSQDYVKINKTGKVKSSNLDSLIDAIPIMRKDNVKSTESILDYRQEKITVSTIEATVADGYPENATGTAITVYNKMDTNLNFQMFYPAATGRFYKRNANNANGWQQWLKYDIKKEIDRSNTKLFNTPITSYDEETTRSFVTAANGGEFPDKTSGLLETYNIANGTASDFQLWHPSWSVAIYKRNWNPTSGNWGPFAKVGSQ